jgi:NAD(P)-dependent dehydrogenase (short-subunit alcohol dehydrogenase family)
MTGQLQHQVALVTGASRGLGRAIAQRFAAEGARVIVADLKEQWAQVVSKEIEHDGGEAMAFGADLSSREAVAALIQAGQARFGRIDIVVNNAMWNRYEPIDAIEPETLTRMLGIGFNAIVWTVQLVAPLMRSQGGGSIINIASVAALRGLPNAMLYCGIKAGVTGLTRSAAVELGAHRIRVNAIAPSTVSTEGVRAMLSEEVLAARAERTPLRRLGEVGDMTSAAVFLASKESAFVTGQVLTVDGGLTCLAV